jgi:hypothetical protein
MSSNNKSALQSLEDEWRNKYQVKSHGSYGAMWTVYANRWHPSLPMRRISPWFFSKCDAEVWIKQRWIRHVNNRFEKLLLGRV